MHVRNVVPSLGCSVFKSCENQTLRGILKSLNKPDAEIMQPTPDILICSKESRLIYFYIFHYISCVRVRVCLCVCVYIHTYRWAGRWAVAVEALAKKIPSRPPRGQDCLLGSQSGVHIPFCNQLDHLMLICFNWSFQIFSPIWLPISEKKIKSFNGESNELEGIKQSNYPVSLIVKPPPPIWKK